MKNVAIFGCGAAGEEAYIRLKSKCRIVGFLDNNPRKHGSRLFGVPVRDPISYDYSQIGSVFIASMYFDEILVQLLELRVPASKIEYVGDEFLLRSSSNSPARWWNLSSYVRVFRRLSYAPFRLLR